MFADAIAAAVQGEPVVRVPKPIIPGLVVHIDGDYLAYCAAGNDETTPGEARGKALRYISGFKKAIGAEGAVVHNTASNCHKGERFLAATVKPYQGQRDAGRKPVNHAYLRELLLNYDGPDFRTKVWSTREADDGMAACACYAANNGSLAGVATADKDMRMFPGLHIHWPTSANNWTMDVTEVPKDAYAVVGSNGKLYGMKWFWTQMLTGDGADNCPGLEYAFVQMTAKGQPRMTKVGPATADKLLYGCDTSDEAGQRVIELYRGGYKGTQDADDRFVEQAALMWMRRGNTAEVLDFADYVGHLFDDSMRSACTRLVERISVAREALNNIRA